MNKPIKGKEEIYKEAWAKWANETFITDPPLKKEDCDNEHSWILGAMDEYAKQFQTPIAEGEERLLAEIKRLRDALDKIQSFHPDGNPIGMINYARAVLNNQPDIKL